MTQITKFLRGLACIEHSNSSGKKKDILGEQWVG